MRRKRREKVEGKVNSVREQHDVLIIKNWLQALLSGIHG